MSHNTNKSGFTLVEVLVSIGILSAISVVLVGFLYTILLVRSKQQSIETSASATRVIFTTIVNAIVEAKSVTIAGNTIQIKGNPCRTIQYWGSPEFKLKQTIVPGSSCAPSVSGTDSITPDGVTIDPSYTVIKNVDGSISIILPGKYKDSFGFHEFNYQTSVTPRIPL